MSYQSMEEIRKDVKRKESSSGRPYNWKTAMREGLRRKIPGMR